MCPVFHRAPEASLIEIDVLGTFDVRVDGEPIAPDRWTRRNAAALVKVLAIAPGHQLHREQVIDALWPDLSVAEAAPRLHKAFHFARRALGRADAIVTTSDVVALCPGHALTVDADAFEAAASHAIAVGATDAADAAVDVALKLYRGELLPADRYEPWAAERRDHLRHLYFQLLRAAGRWVELVTADPTDEAAHLEIIRQHLAYGDHAAARAEYERLERVLADQVGVEPSPAAQQLAAAIEPVTAGTADAAGSGLAQIVQFCDAADHVRLAYAVVGSGPPLVKAANWLTHLEYDWESNIWRHWLRGLAARFRVLRYDTRGCGMSDWDTTAFTLEAWVDDLATVVDAAGFDRFPLLGVSQGAAVAVEYAARHPQRVSALVLYGGYVHGPVARALDADERRAAELLPQLAELGWGSPDPAFRQVFTARFMPNGTREQWDEFNELQRRSTSPANAARFMRGVANIDVTDAAQRVRCPTLVVHVRGDRMPPLREGKLLASLIPGAQFVSLEGENHLMLDAEPAWPRFLSALDRFLATVRGAAPTSTAGRR